MPPDFKYMLAQLQFRKLKARIGKSSLSQNWTLEHRVWFLLALQQLKFVIVLVTGRKHAPTSRKIAFTSVHPEP